MKTRFRTTNTVAFMLAATLLAGCAGGNPLGSPNSGRATEGAGGTNAQSITIGSADFSESQLIATIYSLALQNAGIQVNERLNIGSREVYIAALQDGSIDLVPDYAGALLKYLDPQSTASTTEEVVAGLEGQLPASLVMLKASEAQNKDILAVTQETAAQYGLKTISDLKPVAGELALGGPPEWKTRVNGVVGLRDVYGLEFKEFVSLDAGGPLTMTALTSGQVQVADVFSTDPALTANNLVALEDDQALFAAENVVPVIRADKVSGQITEVLDGVSAALTTEALIEMNSRAATGEALTNIATDWLSQAGLV